MNLPSSWLKVDLKLTLTLTEYSVKLILKLTMFILLKVSAADWAAYLKRDLPINTRQHRRSLGKGEGCVCAYAGKAGRGRVAL